MATQSGNCAAGMGLLIKTADCQPILLAHKIAQIFDARIEDIFIFEEEDA